MKFEMDIKNPDEVEVSLNITMKMKEWKHLKNQLQSSYPSWKLSSIIGQVIERIEKTIFEQTVSTDE